MSLSTLRTVDCSANATETPASGDQIRDRRFRFFKFAAPMALCRFFSPDFYHLQRSWSPRSGFGCSSSQKELQLDAVKQLADLSATTMPAVRVQVGILASSRRARWGRIVHSAISRRPRCWVNWTHLQKGIAIAEYSAVRVQLGRPSIFSSIPESDADIFGCRPLITLSASPLIACPANHCPLVPSSLSCSQARL
jgi:hypothetical protein